MFAFNHSLFVHAALATEALLTNHEVCLNPCKASVCCLHTHAVLVVQGFDHDRRHEDTCPSLGCSKGSTCSCDKAWHEDTGSAAACQHERLI